MADSRGYISNPYPKVGIDRVLNDVPAVPEHGEIQEPNPLSGAQLAFVPDKMLSDEQLAQKLHHKEMVEAQQIALKAYEGRRKARSAPVRAQQPRQPVRPVIRQQPRAVVRAPPAQPKRVRMARRLREEPVSPPPVQEEPQPVYPKLKPEMVRVEVEPEPIQDAPPARLQMVHVGSWQKRPKKRREQDDSGAACCCFIFMLFMIPLLFFPSHSSYNSNYDRYGNNQKIIVVKQPKTVQPIIKFPDITIGASQAQVRQAEAEAYCSGCVGGCTTSACLGGAAVAGSNVYQNYDGAQTWTQMWTNAPTAVQYTTGIGSLLAVCGCLWLFKVCACSCSRRPRR